MSTLLSHEEIETVTSLLERLEPGLLPFDIFNQIARLIATATVVIVPFIHEPEDKLKVLLTKREHDDPYYPNLYHPIGTVIRASDKTIDETFERLLSKELKTSVFQESPVFVGYVFDQIVRGKEISLIHWIELKEKPMIGDLFDAGNLPENIIPTDIPRIKMAIEHFLANNRL